MLHLSGCVSFPSRQNGRARFGDRLLVEISIAPETAGDELPSLILQPLVENALKHGLGPKPGPGRLKVSVSLEESLLQLRVEDDGVGPGGRRHSHGVGLANVQERLTALYQDRASFAMEERAGGGCCVTIRIPRSQVVEG